MVKRKKTWCEKLAFDGEYPKIEKIPPKMAAKWGTGTLVIPAPREVDEMMRTVSKGKLTTIGEIRKALASRHGATIACPITTGIFAWISANAAEEMSAAGKKRVTPYWRTLKTGGELNEKYPGGLSEHRRRLEEEGHTVVARGGRLFVEEYQQALMKRRSEAVKPAPSRPAVRSKR